MSHPEMFFIPHLDQAIIPTTTITVHHRISTHPPLNDALEGALLDIRDNLDVHKSIPLKDPKDNRSAS
jgi:hypothetical protein